jgi:DNA end-binding protein Ku
VVDLTALRQSIGKQAAPAKAEHPGRKPRKAATGQKENADADQGKEGEGNAREQDGIKAGAQVGSNVTPDA